MQRLLDRCQQLGQVELYESLAGLEVPAADSPPKTWRRFYDRLQTAVENSSVLQRYRQLQAEFDKLAEQHKRQWAEFDEEDLEVLAAYVQGTRLFYDCLQLAYTPDREKFEERILAPLL
jgi:hypothetical protein